MNNDQSNFWQSVERNITDFVKSNGFLSKVIRGPLSNYEELHVYENFDPTL